MKSQLEIYRDKKRKYRWRIRADNGRIIGASSQGYARRKYCAINASYVCHQIELAIDDGILL